MNAEMGMQSLRTGGICIDETFIWAYDEIINGLYTINKATQEVKNVLNVFQIFKYGKFAIKDILTWKNYIILVPYELNNYWVIYDKVTGEVQYKRIIEFNYKTIGTHIIGDQVVVEPFTSRDPIIIIDLKSFICVHIIEGWDESSFYEAGDTLFYSWGGTAVDRDVYFALDNLKVIVKVGQNQVHKYFADIPYNIHSIDSCERNIWILPKQGNYIYAADLNGKVVDSIRLTVDGQLICTSVFARIVATEKYIFMLPFFENRIYVYNREKRNTVIIYACKNSLKNSFPVQWNAVAYWEYYIDENKIYFMPLTNQLLIIDMERFEWEEKELFLPQKISNNCLKYWFTACQMLERNTVGDEFDRDTLEIYVKLLGQVNQSQETKEKCNGERIWRRIQ